MAYRRGISKIRSGLLGATRSGTGGVSMDTPLCLPPPRRQKEKGRFHIVASRDFSIPSVHHSPSSSSKMAHPSGPNGNAHTWIGSAGAAGLDLRSEFCLVAREPRLLDQGTPAKTPN